MLHLFRKCSIFIEILTCKSKMQLYDRKSSILMKKLHFVENVAFSSKRSILNENEAFLSKNVEFTSKMTHFHRKFDMLI